MAPASRKRTIRLAGFTASAPLSVFSDEDRVALRVRLTAPSVRVATIRYAVWNYWSEPVGHGEMDVPPAKTEAELVLERLECGHYTVVMQLGDKGEPFASGIAVVPRATRRSPAADSPFAADVALGVHLPEAMAEPLARALKLAGFAWARVMPTRLSAPRSGCLRSAADEPVGRAIAARGIRLLSGLRVERQREEAEQGKPGQGEPKQGKPEQRKPAPDLRGVYEAARRMSADRNVRASAWELCGGIGERYADGRLMPDQYAAVLKAAAIGICDGGDGAGGPIVAQAHLLQTRNGGFLQTDEHGLQPFVDIGHRRAELPPSVLGNESAFNSMRQRGELSFSERQERHTASGIKLWLTACGLRAPWADGTVISQEEQVRQARILIVSTIKLLASGIGKLFWSVLADASPSMKPFGLFGPDFAPNPAFVSAAALTCALGEANYVGTPRDKPDGVEAFLFREDSRYVLALWARNAAETGWSLPADKLERIDMMGRRTALASEDGSCRLRIGPDPVFLIGDDLLEALAAARSGEEAADPSGAAADLRNPAVGAGDAAPGTVCLEADTEAAKRLQPRLVRQAAASGLTKAQRVVLLQRYGRKACEDSLAWGAYRPRSTEDGDIVRVELYNFNDCPMEGIVLGKASGGWTLKPDQLPVRIGPDGKGELVFRLLPPPGCHYGEKATVVFRGMFAGEPATACKAAIMARPATIGPVQPVEGANDPKRWLLRVGGAASALASGTISAGSGLSSVRFRYAFKEKDGWAMPFFVMPGNVGLTSPGGLLWDMYAPCDAPSCEIAIRLNAENGVKYEPPAGWSLRAGWNKLIVPFHLFLPVPDSRHPNEARPLDPARIRSVQLGVRSEHPEPPFFEIRGLSYWATGSSAGEGRTDGEENAIVWPIPPSTVRRIASEG